MPKIEQISGPEDCRIYYRGQKTGTRAKIACIDLGRVTIELTEPDEMNSSRKEFLEEHNGNGVRHYGYYPGGSYILILKMISFSQQQ